MKLELLLISNKKTKVTFLPIIEIEGATQHKKMMKIWKFSPIFFGGGGNNLYRVEYWANGLQQSIIDWIWFSVPKVIAIWKSLCTWLSVYIGGWNLVYKLMFLSFRGQLSHYFSAYTFVSYCLGFTEAEMLSNIFIRRNLKMDEHPSYLYICFNTSGSTRTNWMNFYGVFKPRVCRHDLLIWSSKQKF